jgi:hypothetical protein
MKSIDQNQEVIDRYQNQALLDVRKGGYFRMILERMEDGDNPSISWPHHLEALDSLEQRIVALESRG